MSIPIEAWQFLLAVFAVSFVTGFVCCLCGRADAHGAWRTGRADGGEVKRGA